MLTHDWGIDEWGRNNHSRVKAVNTELQKNGLLTWLDDQKMKGNVVDQMCNAIDDSAIILVFVTQRYRDKVSNSNRMDNCKKE